MFLDVLEMIFDNFAGVISAFDVTLFSASGADISFWELLLGMFTVAVVFGFFLRPRAGSGLSSVGSLLRLKGKDDSD